MDNSLGWINDIKPALNEEQNWVLVNDVNPSDIKEGIKIQKYLFDLGYKWFSSEIIMDTIYSIHHFPSKGLRGDLTYYNNKENERDLADKEIERNNNVYYWSQIKPNEINESNDLQWIRDVKVNTWDGIEFKLSTNKYLTTTYKILDWGDPRGVRVVWRDNDDYRNEWKHAHYKREEVENYVNNGRWVIVNENITESKDDLQWIRDVSTQLPKNIDWWLINDVDPYSLEVSEEIQDFLFDQGFEWASGRRKFLPERFSAISHRGGTHSENSGKFSYYLPERPKKMEQDIKAMEALGEVYYWSQLKSDSLNESNELDWIKDIEAGDLWTPYVGMKFIITDGSEDVIYHILNINDEEGWMELKWKDNRSGEEEYFGYYMEDYYRMVGEDRVQIVH